MRRIALPLLLLGAGLMLAHPCAGQGGTWAATGSLAAARADHTATLLPNGKVLIVGGLGSDTFDILASAEFYDPAHGTCTATASIASIASRRWAHTATLLHNCTVLLAAGFGISCLTSAELYDVGLGFN